MSIMDHDPKYKKLREWREQREMHLWRERVRNSPMRKLIPRRQCEGNVYNYRPITAFFEEHQA